MRRASGRVWESLNNPLERRLQVHRNARLTPAGRLLLCQRIEGGWPVAHAAASMGISRDRAYVWWRRNRLDCLDRPTRAPIRRMEMTRPGELVHVDIKKLGRIPRGGGWRIHGRPARPSTHRTRKAAIGYAFVHAAVDAYSRLAYSEVLNDEQGVTAAAFWERAAAFFATRGIAVERVL